MSSLPLATLVDSKKQTNYFLTAILQYKQAAAAADHEEAWNKEAQEESNIKICASASHPHTFWHHLLAGNGV